MYRVKTKVFKKQVEMHLTEKNGAPWSKTLHRVGLLLVLIVTFYGIAIAEYRKVAKGSTIVIEQAEASWDAREKEEVADEARNSTESGDGVSAPVQEAGGGDTESLIRAAFPEHPDIMIAIAKAESGMNPKAVNVNRNGSTDIGLFQINSVHGYDELSLFDVKKNIEAAREIYGKQGLGAWVAFKSGSYKKFLAN